MTIKEIQEKLISGEGYKKALDRIAGRRSARTAEAVKAGYVAGVADTIAQFKEAGISDFDLEKWDFSDLKISEADRRAFEQGFKELEALDFTDLLKDLEK